MTREGGRSDIEKAGRRYIAEQTTIEVEVNVEMDDAKKILQGNIEELSLAFDRDKDPTWDSQRTTLFWDARLNKETING